MSDAAAKVDEVSAVEPQVEAKEFNSFQYFTMPELADQLNALHESVTDQGEQAEADFKSTGIKWSFLSNDEKAKFAEAVVRPSLLNDPKFASLDASAQNAHTAQIASTMFTVLPEATPEETLQAEIMAWQHLNKLVPDTFWNKKMIDTRPNTKSVVGWLRRAQGRLTLAPNVRGIGTIMASYMAIYGYTYSWIVWHKYRQTYQHH